MLDTENKVPLYYQLVKMLQKKIKEEMQPNDRILSEKEICEMYSVSRTTVRLAMAELEKTGLIYRIQGKGSFVSSILKTPANSMRDIDERNILSSDNTTKYCFDMTLFGLASVFPSQIKNESQPLKTFRSQFLVKENEKEIMLLDYYFDHHRFPTLTQKDLVEHTIDEIVKTMQITIKKMQETYCIEPASQELANFLNINIQTPLLCVEKKYFDLNNVLIMVCVKHIVSERYQYKNTIDY